MMINDIDRLQRKLNWATLLRNLLYHLGFNYVWLAQGVGNVPHFLHVVKQRLNDNFVQEWNNRITLSPRARFYTLFNSFGDSKYLETIKIRKFRVALTRLRVSSHRLKIESGRWHKPNSIPLNERKCATCNTLEDEYHFIIECPNYLEYRRIHIKQYYWKHPNMIKFLELIGTENIKDIIQLAKYIFKSFKLRNDMYK